MLAEGVAPKTIAAVTFTELAASGFSFVCAIRPRVEREYPVELRSGSAMAFQSASPESRRRHRSNRRNPARPSMASANG
jgi:hypothetical protein